MKKKWAGRESAGAGILGRVAKTASEKMSIEQKPEWGEGGSHIPGGLCLGVSGTRTASVKSLRWEDPWKKNTEAREAGTRWAKRGTAGDELREGAGQDLRPPGDHRDLGSDPEWKGNRSSAVSRDRCDWLQLLTGSFSCCAENNCRERRSGG